MGMHRGGTLRRLIAGTAAVLVGGLLVAPAPAWAETVRDKQWFLGALDIAGAHRLTNGAGVVVAVVDSGVSPHPDLAGQVLEGTTFLGTGNGQLDGSGHGTGMASVIAAKGVAANRMLGVAPGAKILPVQVLASEKVLGLSRIAEGVRWAADHGAKVINVSAGSADLPEGAADAIRYAMDKDAVVIAATGNRTPDGPKWDGVAEPASFPGVLAVLGTDREGRVLDDAVRGPEVVLAAPGQHIPVAAPAMNGHRAGYRMDVSGTSVATAVVSGAAALVRARFPELSAPQVIQRLIATADEAGPPGRDPDYGFGRLNLGRALTAEVPSVSANPLLAAAPSASAEAPPLAGPGTAREPGKLPVGLILGVGAAGAALVAVAVVVAWLLLRRRRTPL